MKFADQSITSLVASVCLRAITLLRTPARLVVLFGILPLVSASAAQVSLAWDDNSWDETGFKIERATSGGSFVQIATVGANVLTYVDTTVTPGIEYSYRVYAYNVAGNSTYSNVVSNAPAITTQPALSQTVLATNPATFTVVATGAPAPSYQWKLNSVDLAGATNATLTLPAVTLSDAGNYTVVVSNGVPPDVTSNIATLVVTSIPQTITFGALAPQTFGNPSFALTGTSDSGLTVAYASSNTAVATVAGSTVTIVGAGSTTITASQSGNAIYLAAAGVPQTLTVNKASQTITFGALGGKVFLDPAFSVSATATSSLPVAFSVLSGPATATGTNGSTIALTGAGTVVVRASQAGNANYNAATVVDQSFVVAKATPVVSWSVPAAITYGTALSPTQLNASASVAGSFVYTPAAGITLNGGTGQTLSVAFTPTDTANYNSAGGSTTITVNPATQTITFGALAAKTFGDSSFTLSATAASALPVSFASSNPAVATVSGATVTIVGAGTTIITASQAGNASYAAASNVPQTLTVNQNTQTIIFGALAAKTVSDSPFTPNASSSSGLTVNFASSNPAVATASGTTITLVGVGTTTITASQVGNANYFAATNVTQTLTVTQGSQTITFGALTTKTVGSPAFALGATATSGLPVSYASSNPAVATISGTTVTIVGSGSTVITASQAGNANYLVATNVTQTLTVNLPSSSVPVINSALIANGTVGTPFTYTITATNSPTSYSASGLPAGLSLIPGIGTISGTPTAAGTSSVIVSAANATGTGSSIVAFTIAPADQTITFLAPTGSIIVGQPVTLTATASSGLPVTFSVVSGNASINGNSLTILNTSKVVVRATQSGNANYNSASADLTISNAVSGASSGIYFGTIGPDPFAATFSPDGRSGTLYTLISSTGEALVVNLSVNPDGTFNVTIPGTAVGTATQRAADGEHVLAAAAPTRTFHGQVTNGILSGTLQELGLSFSGTVQPAVGPTAALAGAYQASATASSSGTTYLVFGTQGQAYALSVGSGLATAGMGTVSANGTFQVQTPQAAKIAGTADITTTAVTGTIQLANGLTVGLAGVGASTTQTDRLVSLSTRGQVSGTDSSHVFIAGFVVSGSSPKQVLLRAVGPGLQAFGIQNFLSNPYLQLFNSSGQIVAQNDDWGNASDIAVATDRVMAFKLAAGSRDSAILSNLAPGLYTMMVSSSTGSGIALAEVYDASTNPQAENQQLFSLSTRGFVDTGEGVMIAGFAVTGNAPKRMLVRAVGPGLTAFGVAGVLADPFLTIYQNSTAIAQNDNWETPRPLNTTQTAATAAEIAVAASSTGAFALASGSKDAAIVMTLAPGSYTAIVNGANNSTGAALLEVYQLPSQ